MAAAPSHLCAGKNAHTETLPRVAVWMALIRPRGPGSGRLELAPPRIGLTTMPVLRDLSRDPTAPELASVRAFGLRVVLVFEAEPKAHRGSTTPGRHAR